MVGAILQTNFLQRFHGLLLIDHRMVVLRHHHVFHSGQVRHQIKLLEYQADEVLTHVGQLRGVQILQLAALELHGTLGGRVHAANHVHQRGLARTGGTDDGQPFAFRHGQIEVVYGVQVAVDLRDVVEFK